ncbi:MAG: hypothetical protein OEV64_09415, partial [Desulfobulbaceae bacterium]|nr:hypothetical protein [Desulfobulbaceae bacterium]
GVKGFTGDVVAFTEEDGFYSFEHGTPHVLYFKMIFLYESPLTDKLMSREQFSSFVVADQKMVQPCWLVASVKRFNVNLAPDFVPG